MAKYLNHLNKNKTAYNSYFKWKENVVFDGVYGGDLCDMCIKLHLEDYYGFQTNVINNIENYWSSKHDCKYTHITYLNK